MNYTNKVRDPIHGFINFTNVEKQIIDKREFQRLRHIRQLALTNYVYPGATHTRFGHSLGVMELATRTFDSLLYKQRNNELIVQNFKAINLSIEEATSALRMAALLHDIGHLPFSHGGEVILPDKKKHEDVSIAVINSWKEDIDKALYSDATQVIVQLIEKSLVLPELRFLKDILSGSVDADRMDYLLRDSHHCGVDYGYFDYNRLIQTLAVTPGRLGLDLAIEHGGVHSLEALILARYYMFTQVYYHRTRRIYDIYLQTYMSEWKPDLSDLTNVLNYDDISLTNELRKSCAENSNIYALRICSRQHHSLIYETAEFIDTRDERKAKGVFQKLKNNYPDYEFIIDDKVNGSIHKYYVSGTRDSQGQEFMVLHGQKEYLITDASHIIRNMPKEFNQMRIYVDQKDESTINKLKNEAINIEKEER